MGNRAVQVITVLLAVVVGIGGAAGVRAIRNGGSLTAQATPSPTPSTFELPSPSPFLSPSPEASPSPIESPSPSPEASPAPAPTPTQGGAPGPAPYPAEIKAGYTKQYSGQGSLAVLASSTNSGTTICAGIATTDQEIPSGYIASYFVSVSFADGNILGAGYAREGTTSQDFGSFQQGQTGTPVGAKSPTATPAGTHTYCIRRAAGGWEMTSDGNVVYSTNAEAATSTSGATLRFSSKIARVDANAAVATLSFTVPGFSDLSIDGKPPTQLRGGSTPT
jgi:hypothetical protein